MSSQQQQQQPNNFKVPLSPTENLFIGALGGAVETTLQMPILTWKFCSQEGRALPTNLAGWYRGVMVQAGTVAPITAVQFCFNGIIQQLIRTINTPNDTNTGNHIERPLTDLETLSAAFGAGALSALLYSPVDLITIQQQKLQHGSPVQTIRTLAGTYGMSSLYRGLLPTVVRESVYTAGYLGLSPVIAHHLMARRDDDEGEYLYPKFGHNPFMARVVGACIAGTMAAVATNPVDAAKTCVQSDMSKLEWPNARKALGKMWRGEVEGGIWRVWSGMGPRTVRLCGAFFVCISFQEMAVDWKTKRYLAGLDMSTD